VTSAKTPTRDRIVASAQRMFAETGFATPVRAIAADAGIDAALVIRYFGTKELLFLEALNVDDLLTGITVSGPLEGMGERIVRKLMSDEFAEGRAHYAAMLRATDRPAIRDKLRKAMITNVISPLSPRLAGADALLRTRLIVTQLNGLLTSLSVFPEDPILQEDEAALIQLYGRGIQHLIDNT
jgi:AcrR family transcriptional regulator